MIPLSILDLVRVTQDTDARGAFDNSRDLAAHAEKWGYRRFWVAEHHTRRRHVAHCLWIVEPHHTIIPLKPGNHASGCTRTQL